jgi:hypothetical protein
MLTYIRPDFNLGPTPRTMSASAKGRLTAAAALAAGASAAGTAATPPIVPISPGGQAASLTVLASPGRAGARPVRLTLELQTLLRCGSPGIGTIVAAALDAVIERESETS